MNSRCGSDRGIALLAVLFALTLLMLLALPFAVAMGVGADAAARDVDETQAVQASASVRELLLADAVLSHPAIDPTPNHDGREEFPDGVVLPKGFGDLTDGGRMRLGGELVDLQRYLGLDACSPLLLANAIAAVTRLAEDLAPSATALVVDDGSRLPESGHVWLANEVVRYGRREGNRLQEIERLVLFDQGLLPIKPEQPTKDTISSGALVLDYRCVVAAAWPFLGRGDQTRRARAPFTNVAELQEIGTLGLGGFGADELDTLQRLFHPDTRSVDTATYGTPVRVFNDLKAGLGSTLVVKSALHVGAGATVRLRNLRTGAVEFGLVMSTSTQTGLTELQLPSVFELALLLPVLQEFPANDTVAEPVLPAPLNLNTAEAAALAAVFAEIRTASLVRVLDAQARRRAAAPALSAGAAADLAARVVAARTNAEGQPAPFTGWQDLVERLWRPLLEGVASDGERDRWVASYRNLQTGRDATLEMGTAPICFASGPWVAYRASASRQRSVVAPGIVGRHERSGLATALPGFTLEQRWADQVAFEEALRLDRRAPFWTSTPANLGHPIAGFVGSDPPGRHHAHIEPVAFPQLGVGAPRFPATDAVDASITAQSATTPPVPWPPRPQTPVPGAPTLQVTGADAFARAQSPRGHDIQKQGPYVMDNTSPSAGGGGGGGGGAVSSASGAATNQNPNRLGFPFATLDGNGFLGRFAVSAWYEPQALQNSVLFDYADSERSRNRLLLEARDGNLLFSVLDEAGLDPNPSQSPAGVPRTASEWVLPLAELNLPPNTPLHVAMSAYSGRPADLSVAIDGVSRGRPRHVTYLTAPLAVFDPNRANNADVLPAATGNERYLDLQVESTDGFPPVGVLRVGLELFEYSSISGNVFRCRFDQSLGGRGARQDGREHVPAIPLDAQGNPRIDITDAFFNNINLNVFPAHPVGSMVELYGYSSLLAEDTPMMLGSTRLDGPIGGFAVARAFLTSPRPITLQAGATSTTIGQGIDLTWTGSLELADPFPTRTPPAPAQAAIVDAFSANGGYALLMQRWIPVDPPLGGGTSTIVGGIEVIRYQSRQANRLVGVQRAQQLPGNNSQIQSSRYDGQARQFVTKWELTLAPAGGGAAIPMDDIPTLITWVVPISINVQNAGALFNPALTQTTEWAQILPAGNNPNDLEWVRYDALADNRSLVRGSRAAWNACYDALTFALPGDRLQASGSSASGTLVLPGSNPTAPPWGTVSASSGFVGYTPQIEAQYAQLRRARDALGFRGDPFTRTSSHAQPNSQVMACQRLRLSPGNHSAYVGRVGRFDRVALVQGSLAAASRPGLEWLTVTWAARRYGADKLARQQTPQELLGPWPFQLVAFDAGVRLPLLGPPRGTTILDVRAYDRLVKYPSGELPAAYCQNPVVGGGVGNVQPMPGVVDEVELTTQLAPDVFVEEEFTAAANTFRTNRSLLLSAGGPLWLNEGDTTTAFPLRGGLVLIDSEVIAYQALADGVFTVATGGRGLLNTEPRGHDRGARIHFLTHRPAAILASAASPRDAELRLLDRGALAAQGTLLLGRELLHYAWMRVRGEQVQAEMPRWYPPEGDVASGQSRGLFRGRFGTAAQGGAIGEAVIQFPIRYWDRQAERSDDPELGYFQLTHDEGPVHFRTLRWRQETTDPRLDVQCLVRVDGKLGFDEAPLPAAGLWQLRTASGDQAVHRLDHSGSRIEIRFSTTYRPGACDLATFRAHGWKTTARIEDVRLEYEGQTRVHDERVTAR